MPIKAGGHEQAVLQGLSNRTDLLSRERCRKELQHGTMTEVIRWSRKGANALQSSARIFCTNRHFLFMNPTEKLEQAFVTALALSPHTDFNTVEYGKTQGWDSVAHMGLIAAIENTFDIMLPTEDVIDLSSFSKAKEIVSRQGVPV